MLFDFYTETTGLAFYDRNFRAGDQLDVRVPAGRYEVRRKNAHGAVYRGERFIELRHGSAHGRCFSTR